MTTINLNLRLNGHLHPFSNASTSNDFTRMFPKMAPSFPLKCMSQPRDNPSSVSKSWRKIHGQDDWAGMLDPMDPLLRSEVIRYGELAQACYDAFDDSPYSKYCGSCKVPPMTFFQDLGMNNSGYDIATYLYSSNTSDLVPKFFTKYVQPNGPWNPMVNWMGYVAVSNDEMTARLGRRDIIIAWRGTVTTLEWMQDLIDFPKPVSAQNLVSQDPNINVMAGFLHIYTDKDQSCGYSRFSAREQLLAEVTRLTKMYGQNGEEMSITITGHSLGSALAILSAYDIAESSLDKLDNIPKIPISVFSFSGPRVGNRRFRKRVEGLGIKVLRVFNVHDVVPHVPGVLFNEHSSPFFQLISDWITWFYSHIGVELGLDHGISSFVKDNLCVASAHNLELLLHLLDGYQGRGTKSWFPGGRDKALMNKNGNILKDEYLIPPNWSQVENKGLQKNQYGEWELPEHEGIEDLLRPAQVESHLEMLGLLP